MQPVLLKLPINNNNKTEIKENRANGINLGTTLVGFRYKDGVCLCCDTRTSAGQRIANRTSYKYSRITPKIFALTSGSAADTQFLCEQVRMHMEEHSLQLGDKHEPSVATVANLFALYNHNYKDILQAGLVVGGIDSKGPHVFLCCLGGTCIEQNLVSSGSGSTYIMGLMDVMYKGPEETKTANDAIALGKIFISSAAKRDGASGGVYRYIVVPEEGEIREGYDIF